MKLLASEQKQQMVEMIIEEFGQGLKLAQFTEALLYLLEDVPGFETAKQSVITSLVKQLWSQYHE